MLFLIWVQILEQIYHKCKIFHKKKIQRGRNLAEKGVVHVAYGLVARNKVELDDHIKHALRQGDPNNPDGIYSVEQIIDPFVKT